MQCKQLDVEPVRCNLQHATYFVTIFLLMSLIVGLTACDQGGQASLGVTTTTTLLPPPQAQLVLGQTEFTKGDVNLVDAIGFLGPSKIAVDNVNKRLYVSDAANSRILAFNLLSLSTGVAANIVIGQPDTNSSLCNNPTSSIGGLSSKSLCQPGAVVVDSIGNLYVADSGNNRVLEYNAPITTNGMSASKVFGQPDFSTNTENTGGPSSSSLRAPQGVTIDADKIRVSGTATGGTPDTLIDADITTPFIPNQLVGLLVTITGGKGLGQVRTIIANTSNELTVSPSWNSVMEEPNSTSTYQINGEILYISDTGNNRVLGYNRPLTDSTADFVFGQDSMSSKECNKSSDSSVAPSATSLCDPQGVAVDSTGNLYVADTENNRVLKYNTPLTTDTTADALLGHPLFTLNLCEPTNSTKLCSPTDVVLDSAGNLYVTDSMNNRVLMFALPITTNEAASTVFGQGGSFTANDCNTPTTGAVTSGTLCGPSGVVLDSSGNLYVADANNSRVLKFITPLSGTPPGPGDIVADVVLGQLAFISNGVNFVDAVGLSAPRGVAVDPHAANGTGVLYVADTENNRVLGFSNLSTLSANGPSASIVIGQPDLNSNQCNQGAAVPSATTLCHPGGVAVDAVGNLYVADSDNNRVLFYPAPISTNMAATVVFGQLGSFATRACATANSRLCRPVGVAVDGEKIRVSGTATGPNTSTTLTDSSKSMIQNQFDGFLIEITGGTGAGQVRTITSNISDRFSVSPSWTTIPDGTSTYQVHGDVLYVADTDNNRVLGYNRPLTDVVADAIFGQPDTVSGVCNQAAAVSDDTLCGPQGMVLDSAGNLYVADTENSRALEYNTPYTVTAASGSGNLTADRVFGQPNFFSYGSGLVSATSIFFPGGIALDSAGKLYVADTNNNRILEYDAPLTTDSIADGVTGQPDFASSTCNNPIAAIGGLSNKSLCFPEGVTIDGSGNLYVADTENNRILKFGP